jgi:hypothetical protein
MKEEIYQNPYIYPGYLLEQCVKTWRSLRILLFFGIKKAKYSTEYLFEKKILHKKKTLKLFNSHHLG